jgi:hypothetical protein
MHGLTLTTSSIVNNSINTVTAGDGSGFETNTTWGNTKQIYIDLYNPSDPFIAPQSSKTYRIVVSIRDNPVDKNFYIEIQNSNDISVQKIDGVMVALFASGVNYPYRSDIFQVILRDIASSFYAYPNPFNPDKETANLQYYLPADQKVSLIIYDLIGRRVKTLLEEEQSGAKLYRFTWDGKNDSGKTVLNGVYYVILKLGDTKNVEKLVVLR